MIQNRKRVMMKEVTFLTDEQAQPRLDMIRRYVARPIPRDGTWSDPEPAWVEGSGMFIGNRYHVSNVGDLVKRGVTAVLNCASGGITRLPMDDLEAQNISYFFTNVRQDDPAYPILFDHKTGEASQHLQVAKSLYSQVLEEGGRVMFFCVAGQNRSAALAIAVLMLFGHGLEDVLKLVSKCRDFVLENEGFQRQLVELEAWLQGGKSKKVKIKKDLEVYTFATPPKALVKHSSSLDLKQGLVEIELLIPGLCTMDVKIPRESSVSTVKAHLIAHANKFLLSYSEEPATVSKSWVVLAMFGFDDMYDFPLENEAVDLGTQLEMMRKMFNLKVTESDTSPQQQVQWTSKCRFALVIFSVHKTNSDGESYDEPWKFVHEERPGAPATFLEYNLLTTRLRAWDFVTGESYCSLDPIVFSFSPDPRDKRQFMRISSSANKPVQFHAPGEGGILGMGANAIVHRVELGKVVKSTNSRDPNFSLSCPKEDRWDAAVKRHFSYEKMMAFLENRSEAGLAKRIRMASSLNSDGRVVEFYGLGLGLCSNSRNSREYKFEAMLLARYEEEFSTYTLRKFIDEFLMILSKVSEEDRQEIETMQSNFSIMSVKVLLVSLLNAFRDLTLMGVQAFDFNHLSNVLVSRDFRMCRLIDIDGDSKGSIQLDETHEYICGSPTGPPSSTGKTKGRVPLHKPSLDVDLNTVLPTLIDQLILGKGRGRSFVTNKRSEVWRAKPDEAKEMIQQVLMENFYPNVKGEDEIFKAQKHSYKVAQWYHAVMKKDMPWGNWTRDIYDAMRCIDHLPIS